MSAQVVECDTSINNTPEAVLSYIADVRNRTFYLPSLKSISEIKGEPAGASTSWKWTWSLLGIEFSGDGQSLAYEPGSRYAFRTDGGISSAWTYRVKPEGHGTRLSVTVEYDVPAGVLGVVAGSSQARHQAEVDAVMGNLKTILDL